MSAPTVTERQARLRERVACMYGELRVQWNPSPLQVAEAKRTAEERYPLPRITRPRVVQDSTGVYWRVVVAHDDARIEYAELFAPGRFTDVTCFRPGMPGVSPERVALWADLLARPAEEIDDTGSQP